MEAWQIEAIQALLEAPTNEVEPGTRVYTSSKSYGDSRYHLINKRNESVQIEQVNVDEKWGSRINLQQDELPALIKTLLTWHLDAVKAKAESGQADESLGDLDDHPF